VKGEKYESKQINQKQGTGWCVRERELKGRVPVASHAAAGGGQSNHAEVPRFNLCVCERERRERRERGQQRMGHPRLNKREREMETRAAAAPLQQRMG